MAEKSEKTRDDQESEAEKSNNTAVPSRVIIRSVIATCKFLRKGSKWMCQKTSIERSLNLSLISKTIN